MLADLLKVLLIFLGINTATTAGVPQNVFPKTEIVLIATGDVIPARAVNATMVKKNDFTYPFAKTADFLKKGDIVLINLEAPLIENCPVTNEGMVFCGDPKFVEGLKFSGVNVVSMSNNHIDNYGLEAKAQTISLLQKNNITVSADDLAGYLTVKDKKFGFLSYNDIGQEIDLNKFKNDIEKIKTQVDYVVVSIHWGVEYVTNPTQRQIQIAYLAVDSGADLVLGNHPHWIQSFEIYKNKTITYAHGNFIFDQMWSQETREGVIGKYYFNEKGVYDQNFYPIIIENYSQPRFADSTESAKILKKMIKLDNVRN